MEKRDKILVWVVIAIFIIGPILIRRIQNTLGLEFSLQYIGPFALGILYYIFGNILPYFVIYSKLEEFKIRIIDALIWIIIPSILFVLIIKFIPPLIEPVLNWVIDIPLLNIITLSISYWFNKKNKNLIRHAYPISLVITLVLSFLVLKGLELLLT